MFPSRHLCLLLNLQELAARQIGGVPALPLCPPSALFRKNLLLGRELGVKEGSEKEKAFRDITAAVFAASSM